MYTKVIVGALLGLAGAASARRHHSPSSSSMAAAPSGGSSMPYNSTGNSSTSGILSQFPAPFPNVAPGSPEQAAIEAAALGQLPRNNAAPPSKPKEDSIISLGLIAFNELFEVAFFTELIHNITTHQDGYGRHDIENREEVLRVLKVVQAQEELHELNANTAFATLSGSGAIQPCKYSFPVQNFHDAIALASTFTDVVLSTLPDIQTVFAQQYDVGLIRGVGSVIGQEGEQNGFYHTLLKQVPSQLPFLTAGARDFAFNAILQNFVVPGSCPNAHVLITALNGQGVGLRTFDTLKLDTNPQDLSINMDSTVEFSAVTSNAGLGDQFAPKQPDTGSAFYVTYINQQNAPFSVPVSNLATAGGPITFKAMFPGKTNDLNGLTIAAVTRSDFTNKMLSADDVAADTLFGPALIEINQPIAG